MSSPGDLVGALVRSLVGLFRVPPPSEENFRGPPNRSIASGVAGVWGPFHPGEMVRVHATFNAWVFVGDEADCEELAGGASGRGVPLAAWDRQDVTMQHEGPRRLQWVGIVADDPTEQTAIGSVWVAGRVNANPVHRIGDGENGA